jgi:protein-S-isoprenylcysteine O-methyltransferase Ste14
LKERYTPINPQALRRRTWLIGISWFLLSIKAFVLYLLYRHPFLLVVVVLMLATGWLRVFEPPERRTAGDMIGSVIVSVLASIGFLYISPVVAAFALAADFLVFLLAVAILYRPWHDLKRMIKLRKRERRRDARLRKK